jgi:iron(III) transport system substrate-binding protein
MRFKMLVGVLTGTIAFCVFGFAQEVVVYTSVDQVFSERVFQSYEEKSGVKVTGVFDTEETKSTGIVNRLIAEKERPRADVFFSGDPMRAMVLKQNGVFAPYRSPLAEGLPAQFQDEENTFTGFSARARVILVNTDLVPNPKEVKGLAEFLDSRWSGKTGVANPLFGTTTYHVAALYAVWGEEKAKRYFESLKENGCRIVSSNGEIRRLVSKGEIAFGLTDTDDARVAQLEGAPVRTAYPDQETKGEWGGLGTLLIPSTASLIKGAPHPDEGRKFVDYLLSPEVEGMLAEMECAQMPLRQGVPVPEGMVAASDLRLMGVNLRKTADTIEVILPWIREWVEP